MRLEIGPRDMEKDAVFAGRRDRAPKDKQSVARAEFVATIAATLQSIQDGLLARAKAFRERAHAPHRQQRRVLRVLREPEREPEGTPTPIHGGFALTHFSGDVELEKKIKDDLSVTVRCIPLEKSEPGTCPFTGKPSAQRVVWAKAY